VTARAHRSADGRLLQAVAALCALALGAGLLLAGPAQAQDPVAPPATADAPAGVDADTAVIEARDRLADERARGAALGQLLDDAAGAFERAHAHQLRLAEEVDEQVGAVATAGDRVAAAEAAFARSVAESYMQPGGATTLVTAVTAAPDAGTALHRAALVERLSVRERLRVTQAAVAAARTVEDSRQHTVVRAGVTGAVAEAEQAAAALEHALETARADAERAATAVVAAEDAARERIAEEERRAAAARAAAAAAASRAAMPVNSAPPPVVDGKVCPIGAPNGFIDSWGFPRSGGRRHQGVDIFAVHGMPLYAVADGTITRVFNNRLGGLSVNLVDREGTRYYYAHLSSVAVVDGQQVRAGDVVGANGNSGNARTTPPHLHWQVHPGGGAPVNPYPLAAALCR
jgi:peptidoglycan LD-endopeptidase LytH